MTFWTREQPQQQVTCGSSICCTICSPSAEHKPRKRQSKVPNSVSSGATVPMASPLSPWCAGKGSAGGSTRCSRGSVHSVGHWDLHSLPPMGIVAPALLLTLLLACFSQGLVDNKRESMLNIIAAFCFHPCWANRVSNRSRQQRIFHSGLTCWRY